MILNILPPLANHLWQSTLFAGVAALLSLALRHHRAQIRYALWLAASLKFLVPFSLLVAAGSHIEWRTAPGVGLSLPPAIQQWGQPFDVGAEAVPQGASTSHLRTTPWVVELLAELLIPVWLLGAIAVLRNFVRRWRSMQASLRSASPLPIRASPIHTSVDVLSSSSLLEPGVFGILRPAIVLPEGIGGRLTPAQIDAILTHELCHVRRRDNLTSALHMAIEALFWFHPLVWWIGARLVEERERACDEAVLESGGEPQTYAEGILKICRFYVESPLACAPGVTGANLEKRILTIMHNRPYAELSFPKKILLTAAGVLAVAAPLATGLLSTPLLRAQMVPASSLRFDVTTVKTIKGDSIKGAMNVLPGGGLRLEGVNLKGLIFLAYGIPEDRISGGPSWIGSESFEVVGKVDRAEAADHAETSGPGSPSWIRLQQRLQNLLADRFQLTVHTTDKLVSGYALAPAKGGPKVPPSAEGDIRPGGTMRSRGEINGRNGTMTMLCTVLGNMLGTPVVDRTGLTGTYTYKLEYAQDFGGIGGKSAPGDVSSDETKPSIFTALQDQLGLKLESSRVSQQSIVIDRVEKPSAN